MKDWNAYPPQNPAEFENLCRLVRREQPEKIMEVGSRHGRSLIRLAEAAMPALREVYSIDLPGAAWGADDSRPSLESLEGHLNSRGITTRFIYGDSHDEEVIRKAFDLRVDFLFIDGDHTYEGVKADFENFRLLVRPGGVVAFHDIFGLPSMESKGERMGVSRFWKEVRQLYPHTEFTAPSSNTPMGIGVLYFPR